MALMTPKEFIQSTLIDGVGEIHETQPYIAFAVMAIGIEFLGKCINEYDDWNHRGRSQRDFELAINDLNSFIKYRPLLASHNLWTSLRNGLTHAFVPKGTLTLSSKGEEAHFTDTSIPIVNLRCENFYEDFKNACKEVIERTIFASGKMDRNLLVVPDSPSSGISSTGGTPSLGTTISFSGTP